MKDKRNIRKVIGKLTPRQAFELYAGTDEKTFISNFYTDNSPITDIKEMSKVFAMEIPGLEEYGVIFSLEELEHIGELFFEHLESYVRSKGGIHKLDLYTEDELDKIAKE